MPSLYTHQILAEKVMELLPERTRRYVTREGEYFLGAQGGDVFYLYKMREGQKNLGKYLHRKNVYMVFCNFWKPPVRGTGASLPISRVTLLTTRATSYFILTYILY